MLYSSLYGEYIYAIYSSLYAENVEKLKNIRLALIPLDFRLVVKVEFSTTKS